MLTPLAPEMAKKLHYSITTVRVEVFYYIIGARVPEYFMHGQFALTRHFSPAVGGAPFEW